MKLNGYVEFVVCNFILWIVKLDASNIIVMHDYINDQYFSYNSYEYMCIVRNFFSTTRMGQKNTELV
jgi:hypothetical protein